MMERKLYKDYCKKSDAELCLLKQKAKLNWVQHGDQSTKLFYDSPKQRNYINMFCHCRIPRAELYMT